MGNKIVKRWVLVEVEMSIPELEVAEILDEDIDTYIRNEFNWLKESFASLNIIELADTREEAAQDEENYNG